ncbi:MAG: multiheme c-type cytochrome [Elusimicrobiota bacterium]
MPLRCARLGLLSAGIAAFLCAAAFADEDEDAGIVLYKRSEAVLRKDRQRKQDIQRCAACHPRVYEQWKRGPHAHAFEMMARSMRDSVGPAEGLSKRERKKKIKIYKQECVECHAPSRSVYEDSIPAEWDGKSRIRYEDFGGPAWLELTSGVDCITCHRKGDRVVTRPDYAPPAGFQPPEGFCNPIPSTTFAHIYNCVSCHSTIVEGYAEKFRLDPAQRQKPYLSCEQCHMEHGPDGRGTHYYYWSANPQKIKHVIAPMFDTLTLEVRRREGRNFLAVRWPTDFMPHPLLPDTPKIYLLRFAVLDPEGREVFAADLRLYDPTKESGRSEESVRPTNPTGELVSLGLSEPLAREFELPEAAGVSGTVRLIIRKKSEYKKTDAEAVEVYRREQAFAP